MQHVDQPIEIVAYDPEWAQLFEAERQLLETRLASWLAGGIHHVGSTAVPGLGAKPVIDILAGVSSLEESRASFPLLAELEYQYAPYLADEMHWFCKPHPARRTHHLHLVPIGTQRYADELRFRDALRRHAWLARDYERLKRELVERFRDDREGYTEAKAEFVRSVLARSS